MLGTDFFIWDLFSSELNEALRSRALLTDSGDTSAESRISIGNDSSIHTEIKSSSVSEA